MNEINDPLYGSPRVVKLSGSVLGNATTSLKLLRVSGAVNVNSSGGLVFSFSQSDIDERAFYEGFFFSVGLFSENLAQSQALYFSGVLAANPTAFTLEEIAFLAKTLVYNNWTNSVLMTWEQWENICRTNTVAFATLFAQLVPTGQPPTGTGADPNNPNPPIEPGNTGTGTGKEPGTGIEIQKDNAFMSFLKSIPGSFWWSIGGGLILFFLTRKLSDK